MGIVLVNDYFFLQSENLTLDGVECAFRQCCVFVQ